MQRRRGATVNKFVRIEPFAGSQKNKAMKLHEIIEVIESGTEKTILLETLHKYKKALNVYFSYFYGTEDLILLIDSVSNACQYGTIVPAYNFYDAVCENLGVNYIDIDNPNSEVFSEYETICANSLPYSDFLYM